MKRILAASVMGVLAMLTLSIPASASLTGPGSVRDGKNISVFHNSDFVGVFGHSLGKELTVAVFRNGVKIGTASGAARSTAEGPGLEVNHGPEGAPQPGDCWEGVTPDILPGDRVEVTDSTGGIDQVLVDDITITSAPQEDTSTESPWDIVLRGRASFADGTPIPLSQLSSEMRQDAPRYEAMPNTSLSRDPGTEDGWVARYEWPYRVLRNREGLDAAEQKQAILNGDHEVGYGHVAPLPPETQIAEFPATGGPALGCEGSPHSANAVATTDDRTVNRTSGDLTLNGTAIEGTSAVKGTLSSNRGGSVAFDATPSLSTNVAGQKTWTVTIPRAELEGLHDGRLSTSTLYSVADGTIDASGRELSLLKDTIAPRKPTATPKPGTYRRTQSVTLQTTRAENKIYFTRNRTRPTTDNRLFVRPIRVTVTQTIKAIAVDRAGNMSPVASFRYTIR